MDFLMRSLSRQLVAAMVSIMAVAVALYTGIQIQRYRNDLIESHIVQATALARSTAVSGAVWLGSNDLAGLQEIVNSLNGYPDLRHAIVLDSRGHILAHTDHNRTGQYLHDLPPGPGTVTLQQTSTLVDVVSPVYLANHHIGWIRVGLGEASLRSKLADLQRDGVVFALLGVVLSGIVAAVVASRLTRRLGVIQNAANSVQHGKASIRAELNGHDEAAQLARGFNQMLDKLASEEASLRAHAIELRAAKEVAEEASRAKSTFLANMSHELRTPMNAIMGMTALALRRGVEPKVKDYLEKIDAASKHLLNVLNDILDLSKIEAERLTLEQVDFRLGEVVENILSMVRHKAEEKHLELQADLPAGLPELALHGDPMRLCQILLNLAGNAVKFTEAGSVRLRCRVVQEDADSLLLRWEIRDTGIGVSEEERRRLFTAFEQADSSMTRKYGGTGLGLSISKRLVSMMGGEIGVESEPGQGSTFWFTARFDRPAAGAGLAAAAQEASDEEWLTQRFSGTRVLLAEDEPINMEVSRSFLEYVGLTVDVAEDGEQAVSLASQNRYGLILMDLQMPKLNGLEAAKAIRLGTLNRDTHILAMTANAFDEDRQACMEAGMNDHVGKPVEPDRLYRTLLKWLNQAALPELVAAHRSGPS